MQKVSVGSKVFALFLKLEFLAEGEKDSQINSFVSHLQKAKLSDMKIILNEK